MEVTKLTGKQWFSLIAINVVASLIASYIVYKLMAPKDATTTTSQTTANQVSTNPTVTTSASGTQPTV